MVHLYASLVFKSEKDRNWFRKKFAMLSEDIEDELDFELWAILKFYKTFRKGELYAWHTSILDIVQDRFPPLVTFVFDHIQNIDSNQLRRLIVKLSAAQIVQEAEQAFRTLVKDL